MNIMVRRKYVAFFTLILLSTLIVSVVLSPSLIVAPPNTKPIEEILMPLPGPGNNTSEEGPEIIVPGRPKFTLLVRGAAHLHYLRRQVYTDYINGSWTVRNTTSIPQNVIAAPEITVPHHTERDEVTVTALTPLSGNLFTALYTTRVTASGVSVFPEYNTFATASSVGSYSFSAITYTFDWPVLLNLTAGNQTEYLSAPDDPELMALANRITTGSASDYLKALFISRYLAQYYRLNETVSPPENADRLKWFLFESYEGSSYDFATAFVILARLSGLPARLVEGVYVDAVPQLQVVTERNLHYWAEVYFNGAGWLVFDPARLERRVPLGLNPFLVDPNVFVPFEVEFSPENVTLQPGENTTVRVKLMRVATGRNVTLAITTPWGDRIAGFNSSGIYLVRIGGFENPGYYPIEINASDGEGFTLVGFLPVLVPGNFTAVPETPATGLMRNSQTWVDVSVRGLEETVSVESDSELFYAAMPVWGFRGLSIGLFAPPDSELGWHMAKFVLTSSKGQFSLYLPVFVTERASVHLTAPEEAVAGEKITVNGTVDASGEALNSGSVFAYILHRDRIIVLGNSSVTGGEFKINGTLPEYLSPGNYDVYVVYNLPPGSPYIVTSSPVKVHVKGLARLDVPSRVVSRPGEVVITGSLVGGNGSPVANASIYYLVDGSLGGVVGTGEDGEFSITLNITGIESHRVELIYNGSRSYSPARGEVEVFTVRIDVPDRIEAELGKPLTVRGRVEGLKNGTIKAYVFPGKSYTAQVINGTFEFTVLPFQTVGERSIDFRHGANILKRSTIVVVSPLRIELLTSKAEGEEEAEIKLRIVNSLENPVPNLRLLVELGNRRIETTTNDSGIAVVTVKVPEERVNTTLKVTVEGGPYYTHTTETFTVVIAPKRKIPWVYIGIIAVVGALLLRYRLTRRKAVEVEMEPVLKIIFNNGIPLFREGEVMDISIECDGSPELYVDGKPVGRGRDFRLALPLGEHVIEARCNGLVETARARVVRSYNDAVIEFYERCFLPWAKKVGLEADEMTPREIAAELAERMYPWEPLNALTEVFERAKYSNLEVSREEFIRFYRAMLTVIGGGCVV